jgi:hypothetical protein
MNGHLSDLRTGLPWQMVEIHEPVRLLVIIEASPAAIAKVCERYPGVYELVKHRWIQLALIDPDDGTVTEYIDGEFKTIAPDSMLPKVESSLQWYRRRRDHLRIARIVGSPGSRTQPWHFRKRSSRSSQR